MAHEQIKALTDELVTAYTLLARYKTILLNHASRMGDLSAKAAEISSDIIQALKPISNDEMQILVAAERKKLFDEAKAAPENQEKSVEQTDNQPQCPCAHCPSTPAPTT